MSEGKRRRAHLFVLAAAVLAAPSLWGFATSFGRTHPPREVEPEPAANAQLLFFTGDLRGYLHPCGCGGKKLGGLARRATYLRGHRKPGDLLVDLGNLTVGTRSLERHKLHYVLEALRVLEYDALVPGEGELAFGENFEAAVRGLGRPATICANLVYAESEAPVFPPWHIHRLTDHESVAIVGLITPYRQIPVRYSVLPPEDVLERVLEQLEGEGVTRVIAAGYLEGQLCLDLAARFPALVAVLGSCVPQGSPEPLRRGGAPVLLGGELGQYVAWTELDHEFGLGASGQAWLREDTSDDPQLAALVARHDEEAAQFGAVIAEEMVAALRGEGRVGSEACRECHAAEWDVWAASGHARAMMALSEKAQNENAHCLQCHLEDIASDGWRSVGGVGCEACHGGGAEHVRVARSGGKLGTPMVAAQSCTRCHDKANSPNYDFDAYWRAIAHGQSQDRRGKAK